MSGCRGGGGGGAGWTRPGWARSLDRVGAGRGMRRALPDSDIPPQTDPAISPQCTEPVQVLKGAVPPGTPGGPSPNSSMTTGELQEYWRKEKRGWRRVKLLFEVASARIEERKVSKFVVSGPPRSGSDGPPFTTSFPAPAQVGGASTLPRMRWARALCLTGF